VSSNQIKYFCIYLWHEIYNRFIFIRNLFFDGIVNFFCRCNVETNGKQAILVVRLDAIGDFILWLDSISSLREIYPSDKYNLVLLGNNIWKELTITVPFFDEFIFINRSLFNYDISYRNRIWNMLRNRCWSAVIQPTFSRECLYGDSVVRVCGASERIGSQGDLSNQLAWHRWLSNRWYTKLLPINNLKNMELEINAQFVRSLGAVNFYAGLPEITIEEKYSHWFDAKSYVVVAPGASTSLKQWPAKRYADLCVRLNRKYGVMVIICGSKNETELGRTILDSVAKSDSSWIQDCTGETTLLELISIVKGAKLLVGNDSSAVHIAAAVSTPSVCIVSGIHYGRFIPYQLETTTTRPLPVAVFHKMACYGCNHHCVNPAKSYDCGECLELISVDDVWKKLPEL
jgi:ADP-heptose:LPS heptosyltransferase